MKLNSIIRIPILSYGIWRIPYLVEILGQSITITLLPLGLLRNNVWVGWGRKTSANRAYNYLQIFGGSTLQLEDGFLRSYGVGKSNPPLSLVLDDKGIYYDSTSVSSLESLLNSSKDLLEANSKDIEFAKKQILNCELSKYNYAQGCPRLKATKNKKVLVVDQTVGDKSIELGSADANTFTLMLNAARVENPDALIYIKTHPEVSNGLKGGYLTFIKDDKNTIVLRESLNPIGLLKQVDKVYVVTSTMGFEALLLGKDVTVFGMPWYAGWGLTNDKQICGRRIRKRSVDELFSAAYFHYTKYLNPISHQQGNIFDVIYWLTIQRETQKRIGLGRIFCFGFIWWKEENIQSFLSLDSKRVVFISTLEDLITVDINSEDCIVHWGRDASDELLSFAKQNSVRVLKMEDGFVRSVGLGSDFIRPLSLVLDEYGIYFDPTTPSGLENILNATVFSNDDLARAKSVRKFIVDNGITKYNIEPIEQVNWVTNNKLVLLVAGQVEDDASIRYGCTEVKTNLDLLKVVRISHPSAFIVYKPHPDVMSGNRNGEVILKQSLEYADYVESRLSVVSCINACDELHTMTSLSGFDALLRGKKVVVYGQPFYAGWGLTEDIVKNGVAFSRRRRSLSLDELVAGVLLKYPIYWDWKLKGYTTCESVLNEIVSIRSQLNNKRARQKNYFYQYIRKITKWARLFCIFVNFKINKMASN